MILDFKMTENKVEDNKETMNLFGVLVKKEVNYDLECVNLWLDTPLGPANCNLDFEEFEEFKRVMENTVDINDDGSCNHDIEEDMKAWFDYFN